MYALDPPLVTGYFYRRTWTIQLDNRDNRGYFGLKADG